MRIACCVALMACAAAAQEEERPPPPPGAWVSPFDRLTLRLQLADEYDRPYSIPLHPLGMAGQIALSCEYQQGRPCADGAGFGAELDSAAGFGTLFTAFTRVRLWGGDDRYGHNFELDRAWVAFAYGPFELRAGRDVLSLGPAVRGALMVSQNAAPQDGVRAELKAVELTPWLKLSVLYFIDRLRDPQTFSGTLLDCTRAELGFFDTVQLGGSRMLQFGGQGAPDYGGFTGFIEEHFGRSTNGGAGAENNRLSFDVAAHLGGLRTYYEIAFEDTRHVFFNMLQYDADHLLGIELRDLRLGLLRRVFAEFTHTGWVSQSHSVFRTGMTNAGRTMGSALGPDGTSLWLRADLSVLGGARLSPWLEWLRFAGNLYGSDEANGVFVTRRGPYEHRQRIGVDAAAQLSGRWSASAGIFGERIADAEMLQGSTRWSAGAHAEATYTP